MKDVILRYWCQDTQESGRWIEEERGRAEAEFMIMSGLFDRAYIMEDNEKDGKLHPEDRPKTIIT